VEFKHIRANFAVLNCGGVHFLGLDYFASTVGLIAYAAASILYLAAFRGESVQGRVGHTAFGLFFLATVATISSLALKPLGIDAFRDAGTLLTAVLGLLTLFGHFRLKVRTVGAFIAPLATLILLIQFYVTAAHSGQDIIGYPKKFLTAHVALAILGQAFAICACGVSGVYLRQQRTLKLKILDDSTETPALDRLEWILMASLWAGFIFITSGLLSGALYSQYWGSASGHWVKLFWSIAVWLWYLITLICRRILGFPMRVTARLTFGGFLLLSTTFFGIQGIVPPPAGGN
jgi:ABC-type uncharacterized transport system permease subunit